MEARAINITSIGKTMIEDCSKIKGQQTPNKQISWGIEQSNKFHKLVTKYHLYKKTQAAIFIGYLRPRFEQLRHDLN